MTCIIYAVACSSSQRVDAIGLFLACHFCAVFFPKPPSLFSSGPGKYSTELFSVTVPAGGCLQDCHGYLLPLTRALMSLTGFHPSLRAYEDL